MSRGWLWYRGTGRYCGVDTSLCREAGVFGAHIQGVCCGPRRRERKIPFSWISDLAVCMGMGAHCTAREIGGGTETG